MKFGIHDDAWLLSGPGSLSSRLNELDRIGVDIVRFTLRWDVIARNEPRDARNHRDRRYRWGRDDAVLNGLNSHGIPAVVTLVGTPDWASEQEGANRPPLFRRRSPTSRTRLRSGTRSFVTGRSGTSRIRRGG